VIRTDRIASASGGNLFETAFGLDTLDVANGLPAWLMDHTEGMRLLLRLRKAAAKLMRDRRPADVQPKSHDAFPEVIGIRTGN
jgi:hypothetical protein